VKLSGTTCPRARCCSRSSPTAAAAPADVGISHTVSKVSVFSKYQSPDSSSSRAVHGQEHEGATDDADGSGADACTATASTAVFDSTGDSTGDARPRDDAGSDAGAACTATASAVTDLDAAAVGAEPRDDRGAAPRDDAGAAATPSTAAAVSADVGISHAVSPVSRFSK
jgi:hypothetical protein